MTKIAGFGFISQRHRSADPDQPQSVMDPEHWFKLKFIYITENGDGRVMALAHQGSILKNSKTSGGSFLDLELVRGKTGFLLFLSERQ
jgi:hypothetical protein